MGFVSDFLDAMEYLIQKYQKECATIYSGTVQSVSDKSCSMNVNGNVYNKIAYYGIAPIVGNSYRVFVPFNNMSLAFIIVPSTTTSGSSGVSSVNGKTGNVVLNAADVGALPNTTVIPSKTSQLDNDSGFITDIPIASDTQLGGVKIGTGLSVTANGVLSATGGGSADAVEWDNVLDKPTTIDGYGITDAKIENGTITLGNQTITPLTSAPVTSVNSKTGAVVLTANDVGALPNTTVIPTKTSQLENDSGFINKIPIASETKLGGVIIGDGLTVDANGVVSSEKDTFICTVTATLPHTCDQSAAEIYNAQTAGKIVICKYASMDIPLITANSGGAIFCGLRNSNSLKGIKIVVYADKSASISQMRSGDVIQWESIDLNNVELDPSNGMGEEYIPGVYRVTVADFPQENFVVGAMITQFTNGGGAEGKIPQVMLINGSLSIMVASDTPVTYDSIQILVAHI